jgi:hypothetical protein
VVPERRLTLDDDRRPSVGRREVVRLRGGCTEGLRKGRQQQAEEDDEGQDSFHDRGVWLRFIINDAKIILFFETTKFLDKEKYSWKRFSFVLFLAFDSTFSCVFLLFAVLG